MYFLGCGQDMFIFKVNLEEKTCTRRALLNTLSAVFDLLGLVSPVILNGRKLKHTTLHFFFFFKDPYESGYGIVKHIRSVSEDDQIFCNFLTEKSRVVFLKSMSFSRLELTATKYQPVYLQCGNQSCHLY